MVRTKTGEQRDATSRKVEEGNGRETVKTEEDAKVNESNEANTASRR